MSGDKDSYVIIMGRPKKIQQENIETEDNIL